jgi:hypothetical protein
VAKQRIGESQIVFRDDKSGEVVHEYQVPIEGVGVLSVRMPALLSRDQASEVVDQLRSLLYDVCTDAGLEDFESNAREELLHACEMIREASGELPSTLEKARQVLTSYVYFVDAVESFLRSTATR